MRQIWGSYDFSRALGSRAGALLRLILVGLLLALGLVACGPAAANPEPTTTPGNPLAGTEWQLVSLRGDPLLEDTYISLSFKEEQLEGFAGCNHYGGGADSGGYTLTPDGKLAIPTLARTVMDCPEPQGVMEQEDVYFEALAAVEAYRLQNGRLTLQNASGETLLAFERIEEFAMDPAALPGTAWQLVSMDGQPPLEGSLLTLAFHDEQRASGYAGCRDYVFGYEADEDGLDLVAVAVMGDGCGSEERLRQEGEYTTMLGWSKRFRLEDGRLELHTVRGEVLTYEPLPDAAQPELEGPTWSLLAFLEPNPAGGRLGPALLPSDLLSGTAMTATFLDGQVSGTAGCNQYGGSYRLDGTGLVISDLFQTEMACLDPEGVMAQEQRYLDVLRQVTAAQVYGTRLWLETPDGEVLVFAPEP